MGQAAKLTFRQVERRNFSLKLNLVGHGVGAPRVPEANLLVEVSADDGRAGAVRRHEIIAA